MVLQGRERLSRDIVSLQMFITETTHAEVVMQAVMLQLQPSTFDEVARQQTEEHILSPRKPFEQRDNAGQNSALTFSQRNGEQREIRLHVA